MRYIFYADVYFIQNLMIKVTVLCLTAYCSKQNEIISTRRGLLRIVIVASMATVFEIFGLLLLNSYSLVLLFVNIFEIPVILIAILGKKKIIKWIVYGYFFTMLINGVLEALWNQFGEYGNYIFYLLFSCGVVIIGVRIWKNYRQLQKGIFQVELLHQGKRVQLKGFYDSGNCLKDPNTRKGVHVVARQIILDLNILKDGERVLVSEETDKMMQIPVYIPYVYIFLF